MTKDYATLNYDIILSKGTLSDGSIVFVASHPELKGCKAQGATPFDAVVNLRDARIDYIGSLIEDGIAVPEPTAQWCTVYLEDKQP